MSPPPSIADVTSLGFSIAAVSSSDYHHVNCSYLMCLHSEWRSLQAPALLSADQEHILTELLEVHFQSIFPEGIHQWLQGIRCGCLQGDEGSSMSLKLPTAPTYSMRLRLPEWSFHTHAELEPVQRVLAKLFLVVSTSPMAPSLMKSKWIRGNV